MIKGVFVQEHKVRRSITVPVELLNQIRLRAIINRRSVSMEMIYLMEEGIEASVQADLQVIAALTAGQSEQKTEQTELF